MHHDRSHLHSCIPATSPALGAILPPLCFLKLSVSQSLSQALLPSYSLPEPLFKWLQQQCQGNESNSESTLRVEGLCYFANVFVSVS